MSTYIGGRIIPKHAGTWDEQAEYETLTVVLDEETGDSYISRKAVPAGTALDDEEYRAKCSDYSVQLKNIADAVDVLEAQVAANVAASTDEDADYAAEVVDARVDARGDTYESLGEAVRSIPYGLTEKCIPEKTGTAKNYSNSASVTASGGACDCSLYFEGTGYAGVFARFFGTYDECRDKKYRVYVIGTSEVTLQAIVTNNYCAWGSSDGTTSCVVLKTFSLNEENEYFYAIDIDFSEDKWATFAESYSTASGMFFCIRCPGTDEVDTSFSMYAYELKPGRNSAWKYISGEDDIYLLDKEVSEARGDYDTLSERLSAQEETFDSDLAERAEELENRLDEQEEILKEVTDAHTDTRGFEYDTLSERLAILDAVSCPRLPVSASTAICDNTNGTLTAGEMAKTVVNNNVVYDFDYTAYTTEYDSPAWSTLNFCFAVSYATISSLSDLGALYLDLKLEDADGDTSHDGETFTFSIYINGYTNWAKTINSRTSVPVTIGESTLFQLDETQVENVLAAELPLYIVFIGSCLNTDTIADMDHVRIIASLVSMEESGEYLPAIGRSEYAQTADYAETAGTAGSADTAVEAESAQTAENAEWATLADNFFLNSADSLVNEEGVRYSEGMDSLDLPSDSPYSFKYSFQSLVSAGSGVSSGSGLTKSITLSMTLDASSSQPGNQGYTKQLSGMLSMDTILSMFEAGYTTCYICMIEDVNYPDETTTGSYPQKLLISYYDSSGSAVTAVNSAPAVTVTLSGDIKMYVWAFSFDEDVMESIAEAQEAGTFATRWLGIWNTRKYTGDDPITWEAVWYWQDCAFTDGSYTDEEMASFFQSKYVYWASYVNHLRLKEKFEAMDELQDSVDELQEAVGTDSDLLGSKKLYGVTTGTAANGDNTVTVTLDGYNYDCVMHHEGSGYVGAFFGFFGDYEDCADKQFRIIIVGTSEVTLQAIVTNARNAWGNTEGTIGSVSVQSVSLTDDNNYAAIIDIDFSEEKWATFVENYTYSSTFYFCLRYQTAAAMDTEFILCAYERNDSLVGDGEYVASRDDIYLLEETVGELQESVAELQEDSDSSDTGGIVCWGDSLTAGGGWTTTLASLSGLTVYNAGTGGENAQTIMARQGADVMIINDITIPAECEAVTIATRADDTGITTQAGHTVTPLLQGGTAHVNPVMIGDVEGVLAWTGSSYSDTTGTWTFTRSEAGDEVAITRPTAIRTAYDRNRNGKNDIMIIFMGQNGGYNSDVSELIRMHRLMIDHFKGKEYVILGLSSGTASSRADYEEAMEEEFGRRFISLREYLAYPIYDEDGETIISCYGLDDAGLDATDDDITAIESGQVPSSLLSDSVHYTSDTKTVIGNLLYKKMVELGIL